MGGLHINLKLLHRINTDTDTSFKLVLITRKTKRITVRLSYKVLVAHALGIVDYA